VTKCHADAGEQFADAKGLRQVVVGAGVEGRDFRLRKIGGSKRGRFLTLVDMEFAF